VTIEAHKLEQAENNPSMPAASPHMALMIAGSWRVFGVFRDARQERQHGSNHLNIKASDTWNFFHKQTNPQDRCPGAADEMKVESAGRAR